MDDKKTLTARVVIFAVVMVVIILLMRVAVKGTAISTMYESFAQCLSDKGVKFYGAFWCPHCQAQEADFGMSRQKLTDIGLYKECSTPDGKGPNQLCIDNKIEGYPTWEFPDGSRLTAEQPLSTLAEKSGCVLPSGATKTGTPSIGGGSSPAK